MFWSFGGGSSVSSGRRQDFSALKSYVTREDADNRGTADAVNHYCRLGVI